MRRIFLTLALVFLCGGYSLAEEPDNLHKQIDETRQDIVHLQKLQQQLQQEQDRVQQQLRETELDIGRLEQKANALQHNIDQSEKRLKQLHEKKGALEQNRLKQQQIVAAQARAVYQNGRHEYLKLLLNQQNPERVSRTLQYYQYLSRARGAQLQQLEDTQQQLRQITQETQQQNTLLQSQQQQLTEQSDALNKQRHARKQTLATLQKTYKNRGQQIKARQHEQERLEQALALFDGAAPTEAPNVQPENTFVAQQGLLTWPTVGHVIRRNTATSSAQTEAVLIEAPSGSLVKAVYAGRVVFSDWLRDLGLLVILDHGNGYLSVYGHNQALLRHTGDKVNAGDPIATVGNSGGQERTALYFAIRHQGRPSDPALWCRAQG